MAEAQPVIRIEGLSTRFGDVVVHDNLSMDVRAGEIIALVGGSGSGKTTLLRQVLGLERPSAGTVKVFGIDVHHADPATLQQMRNRWGMLFQHGALFSALSAFDNVAQPMRELRVLPEALVRDAALLKLQMVDIPPEQALRMPADLSGGMVKRVALARALALEPELLFLDEPTAGLDPALSESFVRLIAMLHREMNLTVIMVTHDLDTLLALATRIAVLADKRLIAYGEAEEVVRVDHPFITEYFLGERGQRALQGMRDEREKARAANTHREYDHGK
ncbi:ABC transporter ATP-binding protein [Noviherbaspirillum suwonense]|uniref:Phospholipid/cholesterol/gamma-HCH transport system ATP-binding protein n=1 Tax=Noviherbaspirillum suwonense TaxID=1224511 RepID=A0ABY1QKK4_9BURK|nr:ATP-binding cassette domain-containing protein [Noviherbaspirillum suwonense]SMP73459.1 phospholipid/cholesterol/gamma-HCH transport system ATP-binding protein [Noviherbaspirillum suwonense]